MVLKRQEYHSFVKRYDNDINLFLVYAETRNFACAPIVIPIEWIMAWLSMLIGY